jgi:hypothetical protein
MGAGKGKRGPGICKEIERNISNINSRIKINF